MNNDVRGNQYKTDKASHITIELNKLIVNALVHLPFWIYSQVKVVVDLILPRCVTIDNSTVLINSCFFIDSLGLFLAFIQIAVLVLQNAIH